MKRTLRNLVVAVAAAAVVTLTSCSLFGPSDAEVQTAFGAFSAGIATATTFSSTSTGFVLSSTDGSVVVTMDISSSNTVTETYVFKNYTDASSGYTINGTVTAAVSGYSSSSTTYSMTETGKLLYTGGAVNSLDFHVDAGYSTTGYTYTGYVTANGIKKWTVK